MRVRCPRCRTVHDDPAGRFRCASCGRTLPWHVPQRWLPEQLPLFGLPGEAMTLPFTSSTASPSAGPTQDEPVTGPGQAQLDLLRDSIALVTALLPGAEERSDVVPALLADQEPERLLDLTATTAWLASVLVRQLDELHGGGGTAWLQGLGLGLATEG